MGGGGGGEVKQSVLSLGCEGEKKEEEKVKKRLSEVC